VFWLPNCYLRFSLPTPPIEEGSLLFAVSFVIFLPNASAALFCIDTVGSINRARNCFRAPNENKLSIFCGFAAKSANCCANFIFDFSNY
jgi:hypothetical protein